MASPVHPDTNLIDLNVSIFLQLANILGINETWRRLISILPERYFPTSDDLEKFDKAKEPAEAFLRDLGNKGVTAGTLIPYLENLQLERALLLIKNFEPVELIEDLPAYVAVPLGFNSQFRLECKATGFPRPSFQWYKMSKSEQWEELSEQNSHILDIKHVRYEDDGLYICRVHNRNQRTGEPSIQFSTEFRLQVTFEPAYALKDSGPIKIRPPNIVLHPRLPSRGAVDMGSDLIFECHAKGAQPISYEWFKNGNTIEAGISMYTNDVQEEISSLKIRNIQPEDDEAKFTIQCQATNPGGKTMSREFKFSLAVPGPNAQFKAEGKVALLIGNGNYSNHPKLPNVQNDIVALSQMLKAMNFSVLTLANLDKFEMCNAVDAFCNLLDTNVYGLFYYGGHGFQSHRRCYMIPITSQEECNPQECICLDDVEERMQFKKPALCCLILDMCRSDVFCPDLEAEAPKSMFANRNRIFAYATTNSCSAMDGKEGGNGLFMKHLIKNISLRKPVKEVLDKVVEGVGVDAVASNKQYPEIFSTLSSRLSLTDEIRPSDMTKFNKREEYYEYLINPPNPEYFGVQFGNVDINIVVEPHKQVLDNILDVKLSLNYPGDCEKYSAYIQTINTSDNEKVDFVQDLCTIDGQRYTQVLVSNIQKIKGKLTMVVVLFCNLSVSPPVDVPLGLPLIARACLWRPPTNFEDLAESGFVSH